MTSGIFLALAGIWLVLQTTKGGLVDRLGLAGSASGASTTSSASSGGSTALMSTSGPSASGSGLPGGLAMEVNDWVSRQVPYLWGGASQLGADCSGYIQALFAGIGIGLGRTTYQQVLEGSPVGVAGPAGLGAAQPGDLLFFDSNAHEGLYLGNGLMTDEPHTGGHAEVVPVAGYGTPDAIRRFFA